MIVDAQRAVGLNLLGSLKDLGQQALSNSVLGCFPVAVFLLIEVIDWHEAAAPLEGLAESGLALEPLGLGVDVRKADFDVRGLKRREPPAHHVDGALASSRIIADDREHMAAALMGYIVCLCGQFFVSLYGQGTMVAISALAGSPSRSHRLSAHSLISAAVLLARRPLGCKNATGRGACQV
jgi:hypothetical protein